MTSPSNELNTTQTKQLSFIFTVAVVFLALCLQAITLGGAVYFGQKYLTSQNMEASGLGLRPDLNAMTYLFSWLFSQPEAYIFLAGAGLVILLLILIPQMVFRPLKRLVADITQFYNGNWERRASTRYNHEFGIIAQSFNHLAAEVQQLTRRLDTQTSDHNDKMVGTVKISQMALMSPNIEELIRPVLILTLKHFGYQYAALYLLSREPDGNYAAILRQGVGETEIEKTFIQKRIVLDAINEAENVIAKAFATKQPAHAYKENPNDINPVQADLYHELAIPIIIHDKVVGCLSISAIAPRKAIAPANYNSEFSRRQGITSAGINLPTTPRPTYFSEIKIAELQTVANQISLALRSFHSEGRSSAVANLSEQSPASLIYQAGAQIAQSENLEDLFSKTASILQELPHASALLISESDEIQVVQRWPGKNENAGRIIRQLPGKNTLPVSLRTLSTYFKSTTPIIVHDIRSSSLPQPLLDIPKQMGCDTVAFLPVLREGKITSLLILGYSKDQKDTAGKKVFAPGAFTPDYLQPHIYLLETINATIDKLKAQEDIRKRLAEVQILWNISQTISVENNLQDLYQVIHNQVEKVMGKISSFAVLLYEEHSGLIQVPYIIEEGKNLEINPFPLGEGLTSIVMRTGKPLLITENMEKSIQELGAKTVGAIAKSWLGVPLKYGGETFGIIIAQDIFRENRFSEEDQRLLSTIASQVALVIRNVRLLESSKTQARMERILNQISGKIRRALDMESILQTTVDELAYALNANKASIKIEMAPTSRKNGKHTSILTNVPR